MLSPSIARSRRVQGTCKCSRSPLEESGENITIPKAYSAPVLYGSLPGGILCWVAIVVYMRFGRTLPRTNGDARNDCIQWSFGKLVIPHISCNIPVISTLLDSWSDINTIYALRNVCESFGRYRGFWTSLFNLNLSRSA